MKKTACLEWMVIGAGPAGIATVGKLLDRGVVPESIGWMDPLFQVGDLGERWYGVSSNTKVDLFNRFLHNCKAFNYQSRSKKFSIDSIDPEETCKLKAIAEPLQWITDHLKEKVSVFVNTAMALSLSNHHWKIIMADGDVCAKNVVLATGSEPKNLNYSGMKILPLEVALNHDKLKKVIKPGETIGVFGCSHSAVLILASLCELNANAINFYRSPHHYAIYLEDWILFDNTGLKGYAAEWAKKHLDGKKPSNLSRVLVSDHAFEEELALCDKVVYAVGFERRKLPVLEQYEKMQYQDRTGIIAPGLFGIGIAFPQAKFDKLGNLEYRVGLWKFMDYLNEMLPLWFKYTN
jgi:cation diffusion facilitator CzcD-associated flavoprotein CzcO